VSILHSKKTAMHKASKANEKWQINIPFPFWGLAQGVSYSLFTSECYGELQSCSDVNNPNDKPLSSIPWTKPKKGKGLFFLVVYCTSHCVVHNINLFTLRVTERESIHYISNKNTQVSLYI